MSFALSMDQGALEWASHGLGTIFAQRQNLWKLSFWQMIWDVIRFGREAPKVAPFPPKNHSVKNALACWRHCLLHDDL